MLTDQTQIRAALEQAVNAISPALATAWDNVPYNPTGSTPWQAVSVLFARPEDPVFGAGMHREAGYMQIALNYPTQFGTGASAARAELIRTTFPRGTSFGGNVTIEETPEISPGTVEDGWWVVLVKIRFYANIFN